jgi:hypothetical protein
MCGGCRVVVNNRSEFACVDGPEFDAHEVDFLVLSQRNAMYREQEQLALQRYQERIDERSQGRVDERRGACVHA